MVSVQRFLAHGRRGLATNDLREELGRCVSGGAKSVATEAKNFAREVAHGPFSTQHLGVNFSNLKIEE